MSLRERIFLLAIGMLVLGMLIGAALVWTAQAAASDLGARNIPAFIPAPRLAEITPRASRSFARPDVSAHPLSPDAAPPTASPAGRTSMSSAPASRTTSPAVNVEGEATATAGPTAAQWAKLRDCESGGDYTINTGNGYYGAYQFNLPTWRSNGGAGRPDLASPAEQDRIAVVLWSRRGAQPWPVCGRWLR